MAMHTSQWSNIHLIAWFVTIQAFANSITYMVSLKQESTEVRLTCFTLALVCPKTAVMKCMKFLYSRHYRSVDKLASSGTSHNVEDS